MASSSRIPAVLSLVASILGLWFASSSTSDYASHLDRHVHDVHCSFIPGAPVTAAAEACRAAMYSPYSALFRATFWGGIPISLFAVGAFTFYLGFSLYLLLSGARASKGALAFFGLVSFAPALVSLLMLVISLTRLGQLCKTCVGIYIASGLLVVSGVLGLLGLGRDDFDEESRSESGLVMPLAWLFALGMTTLVPALVYAAAVPDHRSYLAQCGQIKVATPKVGELVVMRGANAIQPALMFEDPLCATCKAFHERLTGEGVLERLDTRLSLFPLDSECNWMLNEPLHPGACLVSKAVICGGARARQVLEWAYENQTDLLRAGKASPTALKSLIRNRWGESLVRCLDDRKTEVALNNQLHFASDNNIPVSTPQVYLGKQRICEEDTDIGLRYTLGQLAPELVK